MLLFKLLALVIMLALVAGQARLTLRSLRTGKAGWGKLSAERNDHPALFGAWIAFFLAALVVFSIYAFGIGASLFL